ncbi:hypothetical protein BT67DRAFT_38989 [Trichocladium antarcticum]|uniref:Uncharacterized protein n=1 Tax=Trichocladium antarcticum TaxID=1450529 RepID=A0AAN6ZDB7_9PEZI|nr:hypothetical protein BT67DRAFT_38989 [Trichocladium antarcticum]
MMLEGAESVNPAQMSGKARAIASARVPLGLPGLLFPRLLPEMLKSRIHPRKRVFAHAQSSPPTGPAQASKAQASTASGAHQRNQPLKRFRRERASFPATRPCSQHASSSGGRDCPRHRRLHRPSPSRSPSPVPSPSRSPSPVPSPSPTTALSHHQPPPSPIPPPPHRSHCDCHHHHQQSHPPRSNPPPPPPPSPSPPPPPPSPSPSPSPRA